MLSDRAPLTIAANVWQAPPFNLFFALRLITPVAGKYLIVGRLAVQSSFVSWKRTERSSCWEDCWSNRKSSIKC